MATRNNNLSVIPFYETLAEQMHRKGWTNGEVFPLCVSRTSLVPFFFVVPYSLGQTISDIVFYDCCGNEVSSSLIGDFNEDFSNDFFVSKDWYTNFRDNGIAISQDATYTCFFYVGGATLNLPKGQYYMKITTSEGHVRYSEVFTCKDDSELARMTKIEWNSIGNLDYEGGYLPYAENFFNIAYLDTEVGKPKYEYEEEGDSRNGYFFPTKQISFKRFTFGFYAPEFLCDALRLIKLSDNIIITDTLGRTYDVSQFNMEASWDNGIYANVQCEFLTDTAIKVIGK